MNQNKPISLIRDELMKEVVAAINKSNLSYFLLEYIFKDILTVIHNGAIKQAQSEQADYLKALKAEEDKAKNPQEDRAENPEA